MSRPTQDTRLLLNIFGYETFTLYSVTSQTLLLIFLSIIRVLQPQCARTLVWADSRSLAATSEISILISLPVGT